MDRRSIVKIFMKMVPIGKIKKINFFGKKIFFLNLQKKFQLKYSLNCTFFQFFTSFLTSFYSEKSSIIMILENKINKHSIKWSFYIGFFACVALEFVEIWVDNFKLMGDEKWYNYVVHWCTLYCNFCFSFLFCEDNHKFKFEFFQLFSVIVLIEWSCVLNNLVVALWVSFS